MAESALSMDLGLCLSLLVTCSLLYFLIQFIRLIMADSDLTLQWAEYFGHTPEISSLEDQDILILPLDMTQMSMHKEATEKALQHFGRIDILINNAGRWQRSLFVETNLDVFRALIELNYLGTISITKQVLQHMIERKRGRIVNISSAVGLIGAPLSTGYSASKHALQGFFNSLRTELTTYPDIIISNICPGPVQSNIVENALTEECDKVLSIKTDQSHKMATERCARLVLITAANNLKETWISGQPFLMGYYLWQYTPTWAWWLTAKVGERRIKNFKSGVDADSSYFTKKSK
ncbi:dehydrogenase/reductase SDR family member 7 isoform X4 [Xenopus laevis]|uniref:Dehydrogenase/reductase SDR family member 7 isoform X4 n=1 Tax=Xenopus laevis TaxID=8355 RepID=A0A8J1LME8_XENLA|nr:dehydrogenase/reductase SDR family member 7 isoform X4 [Xenopus laevis]